MSLSRRLLLILVLSFQLAGCQLASPDGTATASPTLARYLSPTPSRTATTVQPAKDGEDDLLPTPTPFVHVIAEGETLLDIALQYGVSLEDMQAANPEVDPRFLSIGQRLRIPGPEGQPSESLLPTSTPVPLDLGGGRCYQVASGALWCLSTVANETGDPVEGITGRVRLVDAKGETMARELAFTPLNRLEEGDLMPLVAYFAPPAPEASAAFFDLLSAVVASDGVERYIEVELDDVELEPDSDRRTWKVDGQLDTEGPSRQAALLALGFDERGDVVGYTKWTPTEHETGPYEFHLTLYSLGPPIATVEVMAEALRPLE